jgi:hypothetical protein
MPNSIDRRRLQTPAGVSDEVEKLKAELETLRKLYLQDMANVSQDMRSLSEQVSPSTSPSAPVVDSSNDDPAQP